MSTVPERLKSGARRAGNLAGSVERGVEAASEIVVEVKRVIANAAVALRNVGEQTKKLNEQSEKLDTIITRLDKLEKVDDNIDTPPPKKPKRAKKAKDSQDTSVA